MMEKYPFEWEVPHHRKDVQKLNAKIFPQGYLWCSRCQCPHILEEFVTAKSRYYGYANECRKSRRDRYDPIKQYERHLQYRYKLSSEEYTRLLRQQNNCCAVCKEQKTLVVDHDHVTGKVRGLLCAECNFGLGMFKDTISYMKQAIEYLGA